MKQSRFKFSVSSLLWLVFAFTLFLVGYLAPSPYKPPRLEPIIVATDDLRALTNLSTENVKREMRDYRDIPDDAATKMSQVEGGYLLCNVGKNELIKIREVEFDLLSEKFPPGFKVVNVRLEVTTDPLTLYLLKTGAIVRLEYQGTVVLKSVRAFSVDETAYYPVALVVDEKDAAKIAYASPNFRGFKIAIPTPQKND